MKTALSLIVLLSGAGLSACAAEIQFTPEGTTSGGLPAYRVQTPTATYFLEKTGAGLSSMIDRDGYDWLSFDPKPGSGAGGEYRGFPNAVHQQAGNYFHPKNRATEAASTKVEHVGPDRVTISAISSNRLWACRYDFFPTHCTFTMTRMPPEKRYWVLYEGTPGGQYDDTDWWITSDIKEPRPLTMTHDGDIPAPEWIAFGDRRQKRVLFLLNHQDDDHPDRFYQMDRQMTVFGFGRKGLDKYLDHVPQSFTIGLLETTNHAEVHEAMKAKLKVISQSLLVAATASLAVSGDLSSKAADDPSVGKPRLDSWTYVCVDDSRGKWGDWDKPKWLCYFGLDMADVTADGYTDIVAGRYFYRNPGGDMTGKWVRSDLGLNVDGMLFVDVDGDQFGDVIAMALPKVYWLEAKDSQCSEWNALQIGTLKATRHVNGQGYALAQITPGGKPEILLACEDGVYCFEIPADPQKGNWPKRRIAHGVMDEGIGVGDLDGDGDVDVCSGMETDESYSVMWFDNPGDGSSDWPGRPVGPAEHAPDRIVVADVNGDGHADVVVSEERWPGEEPDANLYWYQQMPGDGVRFERHTVVTEYSLNNLDVADMDGDGDVDIVTCEHKGPKGRQKLQIFENDGKGRFTERLIDRGKESHLGTRVADMDGDGDLDIVSIGWDYPEYLHLWRNNAKGK